MDETKREDIALFRYGMILPFLSQEKLEWGLKTEILKRAAEDSYEIPHSKKYTLSAESIRKWTAAYLKKGFDGLKPKKRRDAGKMRSICEEAWRMAASLRKESPTRSVAQIIRIMEVNGIVKPGQIKRSTLSAAFKAHGYDRQTLKQNVKNHRRFQAERPNKIWQSDMLYGPYLPDPAQPGKQKRTYLVAFIDDFSRLILHAEFFWDGKYPALENTFQKAILKRGLPEIIYVDNGSVYCARHFDAICASLGIRKISCRPYHPAGKGKIERFFRSVRDSFLSEFSLQEDQTLKKLNTSFHAWLEVDYHNREHSAIEKTPLACWRENIGKFLRMPDREELQEIFLFQESRKVDKVGLIQLKGVAFEVQSHLKNRQVQVRYNPFDLSWIKVYYQGHLVEKAAPLNIPSDNRSHKRQSAPERKPDSQPQERAASGVDFLGRLEQIHQEQNRRTAADICGKPLSQSENQRLNLAKFIHTVALALGKQTEAFHPEQIARMKTFWQKHPNITTADVALSIGKYITAHGKKQHIHHYLQAIAQQIVNKRHQNTQEKKV